MSIVSKLPLDVARSIFSEWESTASVLCKLDTAVTQKNLRSDFLEMLKHLNGIQCNIGKMHAYEWIKFRNISVHSLLINLSFTTFAKKYSAELPREHLECIRVDTGDRGVLMFVSFLNSCTALKDLNIDRCDVFEMIEPRILMNLTSIHLCHSRHCERYAMEIIQDTCKCLRKFSNAFHCDPYEKRRSCLEDVYLQFMKGLPSLTSIDIRSPHSFLLNVVRQCKHIKHIKLDRSLEYDSCDDWTTIKLFADDKDLQLLMDQSICSSLNHLVLKNFVGLTPSIRSLIYVCINLSTLEISDDEFDLNQVLPVPNQIETLAIIADIITVPELLISTISCSSLKQCLLKRIPQCDSLRTALESLTDQVDMKDYHQEGNDIQLTLQSGQWVASTVIG